MDEVLIRRVRFPDGSAGDLRISDGIIVSEGGSGGIVIEGEGYLALPGFCNTHTHASMSLLRGVGEGLELDRWLREAIWPLESKMTVKDVEAGMRLSCLEMIRTGTTFFNDMYFHEDEMASVVRGMGLRAVLGEGLIDSFDKDRLEGEKKRILAINDTINREGRGLVVAASAPHAVYTVSDDGLDWAASEAGRIGGGVHVHACETASEVEECARRNGASPVGHLAKHGLLGKGTVVAHSVHLSDGDIGLMASSGSSVSLNPISNMKLGSGGPPRYPDLIRAGVNVTLGTDGPASNNSQSMLETLKIATLCIKSRYGANSASPSGMLKCATSNGYGALGVNGGSLEPGNVGDVVLLDIDHHSMVPGTDPLTNIVFSASPEAISYTIVGGRVLMEKGKVKGSSRIVRDARKAASDLIGRIGT